MFKQIESYCGFVFGVRHAFVACVLFSIFFSFAIVDSVSASCSIGLSAPDSIVLNLIPNNKSAVTSSVTASTDCFNGYTLYISGPVDAKLYNSGDNTSDNYIAPVYGTVASPTGLFTDTYGYSLGSDISPNSSSFIGLTDESIELTTTDRASSAGGEDYDITYGALVSASKIAGSYTMADGGSITYYILPNDLTPVIVTLDANGGTIPEGEDWDGSGDTATKTQSSITYGALPEPVKDNSTFLGWKDRADDYYLPEGYQEVEYIQMMGSQYIDTNYALWKNEEWKLEYKFDVSQHYNYNNMLGSLQTDNIDNEIWINSDGEYIIRFPSTGRTVITRLSLNTPYIITHDNSGDNLLTYINGDLVKTSTRANTSFSQRLGFGHRQGSNYLRGKVYYMKFWNEGNIVRYLVPCYRTSDNVAGMYDVVENVFYTNQGSGEFGVGEDIHKVTSSTELLSFEDHTLYATWSQPLYDVNVSMVNGTVDEQSKQIYEGSWGVFNVTSSFDPFLSSVSCTNNQEATLQGGVLKVMNVTANTTCTVTYSNPGSTVLYSDGTFIINESSEDREQNIVEHGTVTKEYAPFSTASNYVFGQNNALWYSERNSIKRVEIGQPISPTSTAYWFDGDSNMAYGDFTNLDTSNVTNMHCMFRGAGNNSSVTSFALTGLSNWNTEKVTDMSCLFEKTGYYASSWSIGDLSSWDTDLVANMSYMFYYAAYSASVSMTPIGTLKINATNIYRIFAYARYMKATLNLHSNPANGTSGYSEAFYSAANQIGALITVNHGCDVYNIDDIIATRSNNNSNVVRGIGLGECTVAVNVNDGSVDETNKQVNANTDAVFTINPDDVNTVPVAQCTRDQSSSINGNILTVSNVTLNTTCSVFYKDATVLYNDGTLIINENTSDRATNTVNHGGINHAYAPLSSDNNYVFGGASNVLWYNERNSIVRVEIGQIIAPTSTNYWFNGDTNLVYGDFTNLDTSNVTSMYGMFDGAGNASSATTFTLIGLSNWNTEKVTNMSTMFYEAGLQATTWSIGDLSNWDTGLVTDMSNMFYRAAYNASASMTPIGTLKVYATNIYRMFYNTPYMKGTLELYSNPASGNSGYNNAFYLAAVQAGASITVNHGCAVYNIDDIIATKSNDSNVARGIGLGECTVDVNVSDGVVDAVSKSVSANTDVSFTITPNDVNSIPVIQCTNNQVSSINGNILTVSNVTLNATCAVYYKDATVLYNDGTLIINEDVSNRTANITNHNGINHVYAPLSGNNNYVFSGTSSVLWYNERSSIRRVEIGQLISPTSTAYWFDGDSNITYGDFTNLDTSNVTTMYCMFRGAGNNSGVTTFTLTGLNGWNTEKVTNMAAIFQETGRYATTWSIGDLSSWDTDLVTNMSYMFYYAAYSASVSMTPIGTLKINATNIYRIFAYARYMKATLDFYSNPRSGTSGYNQAFSNAANQSDALIIVNYSNATTNIDNIINTKSSGSNVVKGVLLD